MNRKAVGIDVSNGHSTVMVLAPEGKVIVKPFEIRHTVHGFIDLTKRLTQIDGDIRIVMEHTGRYYESIANILHEKGYFVSAVNPLLLKGYGNNSLRNIKTDKADAQKIANYTLDNWHKLREYSGMDTIRYNLKTVHRQFQFAEKQHTESSNNLIALLEQSFPGVRKLFSSPAGKDGSQKWVDFVSTFYHADCVRETSLKAFTTRYQKWCARKGYNFREQKAVEIYNAAKEMVVLVPKTDLTKLLVQQAAEQLTSISRSVEIYRAEMNRLASQLPEYPVVMDMYGAGNSTGPQLMAEIGDIRRFAGKQSLVAFAGIDPLPNESGDKYSRSNRTTKRGSPYLRKTLFNIMDVYLRRAPAEEPVYQFLDKKRREGKPYYVYMTAGANKFLRRYYAKVRDYLNTLEQEAVSLPTENQSADTSQENGSPHIQ